MQHQAQENDPGIESFTCKDLWNKKIHLEYYIRENSICKNCTYFRKKVNLNKSENIAKAALDSSQLPWESNIQQPLLSLLLPR